MKSHFDIKKFGLEVYFPNRIIFSVREKFEHIFSNSYQIKKSTLLRAPTIGVLLLQHETKDT